jgi:hypothetical protein
MFGLRFKYKDWLCFNQKSSCFIGLICVNWVEEIEQFTAMSLLISHDKCGFNAKVLKNLLCIHHQV